METSQVTQYSTLSIPRSLKVVGVIGGVWAILVIVAAVFAYRPEHPDFSIFNTYLSDMGDTPGWPQIFFNSGTLIAVPIRYLVLVLLVMRLRQLGAGKLFAIAALIIGFLSTSGTALMTATPFSVSPIVHKTGIGLYFLGVVVLQTMIFFKEWSLKNIPRILPVSSIVLVVLYFVFVILIMLYEQGVVSRSTPVIWEWLAIISSIVWMLAQSILLGRNDLKQPS
ncbi:MAG: DUF998 domain-containing protein [Chloroflexota bacterium]